VDVEIGGGALKVEVEVVAASVTGARITPRLMIDFGCIVDIYSALEF